MKKGRWAVDTHIKGFRPQRVRPDEFAVRVLSGMSGGLSNPLYQSRVHGWIEKIRAKEYKDVARDMKYIAGQIEPLYSNRVKECASWLHMMSQVKFAGAK